VDSPRIVILGGQPGSGKSSAIEKIEQRFNRNIVALNGDDFKTTYPGYDDLLAKDAIKAAKIVQPYNLINNKLTNVIEMMQSRGAEKNEIDEAKCLQNELKINYGLDLELKYAIKSFVQKELEIVSERTNLVRSSITNVEDKPRIQAKLNELTDEVKGLSAKLLPEIKAQLSKLGISPKYEHAQQLEIIDYLKFNNDRVNLTESVS
jgi:hypothetical protein